MAILDVLTVYQSWNGLQLFDEVKVQMHRYTKTHSQMFQKVEYGLPAKI